MKQALINGRVFTGDEWLSEYALIMERGRILDLCDLRHTPTDSVILDIKGQRLVPGLIDTQVNGGGGVLFNAAPDIETLRTIGKAPCRFGTTGFLPTLVSDECSVMHQGIQAVSEAMTQGAPG